MNLRPVDERHLSCMIRYIPEEDRQELAREIEYAIRTILENYRGEYGILSKQLFYESHNFTTEELEGRDIADYIHDKIMEDMFNEFENIIRELCDWFLAIR